ncbi:hypothetical protein [Pseudactinotalea sp. Z1732]|uniref:hypothetical protein n=1 Tax=Micrococcales TaxID=85006 RepID=UPI003C7BB655
MTTLPPNTPVIIRATGRTGTITGHLQDPYGGQFAVNVDGRRTWHRAGELEAVTNERGDRA